ncbi:hypothetical protein [Nocardioides sp. SR21]|uniref:hypothetical protein n=1 Tax=Nocardioides sp. SR21 TaxID=2919501 RepID=UPI001FAA2BFA|nr:hypothetical protein [Nocardioides sp. SR21]
MRNDADFTGYLAARWPSLVRSLVLIGCPRREAEELAVAGLVRCYPSYDRVRESDDIDVHVYATVLDGWHHRLRHGEVPAEEPVAEEETDDVLLRREIEAELATLTAAQREQRVLRYVAELDDEQVADVLERAPGAERGRFSEVDYRIARETIEVSLPPYDEIVRRAQAVRRRRGRIAVASTAAGVLVVAGLTWLATRPEPGPEPNEPKVEKAKNPIDQAWYGNGLVHLQNVTVEVPQVDDLVEVGGGVIYAGADRVLVRVGPNGELSRLGTKGFGSRIVASDERGWAAWVGGPSDNPEMVVHDVATGEDVARVTVPPGSRAVALDQNRVYYVAGGESYGWDPLTGRVELLGPTVLLDVESATRAYALGPRIDMVQPFFNVDFVRPGVSAEFAPGGNLVVARPPGQEDGPFAPLLYDARSGERLETGVAGDELVLDASFGPDGTIDYLVIRAEDYGAGPDLEGDDRPLVVLRTCELATTQQPMECTDVLPLAQVDEDPLLAH